MGYGNHISRIEVNLSLLLQQVRQGNEAAFAKIYEHFSPQLYQTILYFIKDEEAASEIVQDLFLRVWNKRALIEPEKTFWPYLYQIAKWMVKTHYKKVARDKKRLDDLIIATVDHESSAEDLMIHAETHALLAKAIESLPPKRKEVFKLCKIEGKSHKEVSELLGISIDTISNQIKAANKSLKEFFLLNSDLVIIFIVLSVTCAMPHVQLQS